MMIGSSNGVTLFVISTTINWTMILIIAAALCAIISGIALILSARKKKSRAARAAREENIEVVDLLGVKTDIQSFEAAKIEFNTPLTTPKAWNINASVAPAAVEPSQPEQTLVDSVQSSDDTQSDADKTQADCTADNTTDNTL